METTSWRRTPAPSLNTSLARSSSSSVSNSRSGTGLRNTSKVSNLSCSTEHKVLWALADRILDEEMSLGKHIGDLIAASGNAAKVAA